MDSLVESLENLEKQVIYFQIEDNLYCTLDEALEDYKNFHSLYPKKTRPNSHIIYKTIAFGFVVDNQFEIGGSCAIAIEKDFREV